MANFRFATRERVCQLGNDHRWIGKATNYGAYDHAFHLAFHVITRGCTEASSSPQLIGPDGQRCLLARIEANGKGEEIDILGT